MKKIKFISFIMVILVFLLSVSLVSCNNEIASSTSGGSTSSEQSTTSSSSGEDSSSNTTSGSSSVSVVGPPQDPPPFTSFSSKDNVMRDWEGKTLNVLVTRCGNTASAPWGQVELNPNSFGTGIGQAYDERQAFILDTYGVTVEWVPAQGNQTISMDLATAEKAEAIYYDIAIPRIHEVQALVSSVYNMHDSDYLDFTHDYFSQAAYEAHTINGYTLFASGGHDFLEEMSSHSLLFNKDMLDEKAPDLDIYELVRNGEWTYDKLKSVASLVSTNSETPTDNDSYGLAMNDITDYYYNFGVLEIDIDPDCGFYRSAFYLDTEKNESILAYAKEAKASKWFRASWSESTARRDAFGDGRVLFLSDESYLLGELDCDFTVGVAPFPKLNSSQKSYIAPVTNPYSTLICIPRTTQDRDMAEYFVDVLSWTGEDYTSKAYYDKLKASMNDEVAEENTQMLFDYVFKNIKYDVGYCSGVSNSFAYKLKQDIINDYNSSLSVDVYAMLRETVQGWNNVWAAYDGDS